MRGQQKIACGRQGEVCRRRPHAPGPYVSHTIRKDACGICSVNHGSFPVESCQTGQRPHKATRNGCCLATGPSEGGLQPHRQPWVKKPPCAALQKTACCRPSDCGNLKNIVITSPQELPNFRLLRAGGGLGLRRLKREGLGVQRRVRGLNGLGGFLVQSRA